MMQGTLRVVEPAADDRESGGQPAAELPDDSRPIGLPRQLWEDFVTHGGPAALGRPGFHTMVAYRLGSRVRRLPLPLRLPLLVPCKALYYYCRFVYGIELPSSATLGRRVKLAHQSGIVIHWLADIGDDCVISQNVTIGGATGLDHPTIGRNVHIAAGAVVIGDISVGDGARIGPNAVIMSSLPAGATAFAPPARVIKLPTGMRG